MRLKDGLILREVAGQYVIVPIGKMSREIPQIHYMTKDAAMIWEKVYGRDFTKEDIINILKEAYPKTREGDILYAAKQFIEGISSRWLLHKEHANIERIRFQMNKERKNK